MEIKKLTYLWNGRKCHCGMPLSFTRYAISDDRLFISTGLLNIKDEEILLYRIRDISMHRNLWQRMTGVGCITVDSSDKSSPTVVLQNVKNPREVKELLHQQVEEMKIRRKVRIGEITTTSDSGSDDLEDEDDIHDDEL